VRDTEPEDKMEKERLIEILNHYKEGKISLEETLKKLRNFPFENIDFARLDTHRNLRTNYPEVIFCQGKKIAHVVKIFKTLYKIEKNIIATRADDKVYRAVKKEIKDAKYVKEAKIIYVQKEKPVPTKDYVLVITGGTSDIPVAEEAAVTLEFFGSRVERLYDVGIAGLHRILSHLELIQNASVIIAIAGMEGALPGVISGIVNVPVIAVPTSVGYGANFSGIAPLLSMLNSCAPGVAVVNIDNGFGAAYLADMINKKGK
jgi:NCAIR mutase (PurE)-related protein